MDVLAWVGEDELGSGEIGIKHVLVVPHGLFTLALVDGQTKVDFLCSEELKLVLREQVRVFGKPLRLVRFRQVEVLDVIAPSMQ